MPLVAPAVLKFSSTFTMTVVNKGHTEDCYYSLWQSTADFGIRSSDSTESDHSPNTKPLPASSWNVYLTCLLYQNLMPVLLNTTLITLNRSAFSSLSLKLLPDFHLATLGTWQSDHDSPQRHKAINLAAFGNEGHPDQANLPETTTTSKLRPEQSPE